MVAVPNLSSLPLRMGVAGVGVEVEVALAEVVSEVVSVEVDVGLAEDVDTETEDLETGVVSEEAEVAVASEVEMTLDPQEVVAATGAGVAVWATTVEEASTTDRLPAGTVLPDLVDQLDQVGMVLTAGAQVMVRPAAAVALAETEDTSSERAQGVSTTETQSDHDIRSFAISLFKGMCKWVV